LEQENDLLIKQQNDNKKEIESMKMEVCKKNNEGKYFIYKIKIFIYIIH